MALFASSVAFFGCATAPVQHPAAALPSSPWGGKYAYSYEPKQVQQSKSIPVNVAVVNAFYKQDENSLKTQLYSKVAKGFSASMAVDLDKILIKKGFTATGPFAALDEITYSQKKDSTVTLAPQVFITAEVKTADVVRNAVYAAPSDGITNVETVRNTPSSKLGRKSRSGVPEVPVAGAGNIMVAERDFKMTITGWISFEMHEPLSGQKLWIKKLELESVEVRGMEIFAAEPVYTEVREPFAGVRQVVSGYRRTDKQLFDGKADAVADYLKNNYPVIMNKFETYLDSEEMLSLKEKSKEIRDRGSFKL